MYTEDLKKVCINFMLNDKSYNLQKQKIKYINDVLLKNYSKKPDRSTIYKWLSEHEKSNIFDMNKPKKKRKKRKSKIIKSAQSYLKLSVIRKKIININEIREKLIIKYGIDASRSYLYLLLKNMKITNKKVETRVKKFNKAEYDNKKRELFNKVRAAGIDKLVSLDETGIYKNSVKKRGWSGEGKPCIVNIDSMINIKYSLIVAITTKKTIKYKLHKGSIDKKKFNKFIMDIMNKYGNQYSYLMDNASIHKNLTLKDYIEKNKINVIYNIPYCPEFNPIELLFSPLKNNLSQYKNKNYDDLHGHVSDFFKNFPVSTYKKYYDKALPI